MQKPQQRKYHSSCNRSVHTGTAHGKQRVKVCKRKTPHLLVRSFLSPYGDGTKMAMENQFVYKFSPPCGDCTKSCAIWLDGRLFSPPYGDGIKYDFASKSKFLFSPPYGDCTLRLPDQGLLQGVFAPLRGWYQVGYAEPDLQCVFAPLRGWYFREGYQRADPSCFRPLAGIVPP